MKAKHLICSALLFLGSFQPGQAYFYIPPIVHDPIRCQTYLAKLAEELEQWHQQYAEMTKALDLDGTVRDIKNIVNIKQGSPGESNADLIQLQPALEMLQNLPKIESLEDLDRNVKGIIAITRANEIYPQLKNKRDGVAIVRNEATYRPSAVLGRRIDQYELERDTAAEVADDHTQRLAGSIKRAAGATTKAELIASEIEIASIDTETAIADLRREIRLYDALTQYRANQALSDSTAVFASDYSRTVAVTAAKRPETGTPQPGDNLGISSPVEQVDAKPYVAPSSTGDGYRDPISGLAVSEDGVQLIIEFEVGGESYYNSKLSKPTYPGGASGPTVGIGYDLGYNTPGQIEADWSGVLDAGTVSRLKAVAGLKRGAAQSAVSGMKDISIPFDAAKQVFYKRTMPRFAKQTQGAFPGTEHLHGHCQGSLLSLVFNRGPALKGERRVHMRQIRDAIVASNPSPVPGYFRDMKSIWAGEGLNGLLRRRDAEASLFQQGL